MTSLMQQKFLKGLRRLLFCSILASGLMASAETWKVITLDWPPYADEKAAGFGVASKALRESLGAVGIKVEFVFMPWTRGIYEVNKKEYVGIFPVWTNGEHKEGRLSPLLFESPIGFIYNKTKPLTWQKLEDFRGHSVGTVRGYKYPGEFMELVKKGVLKATPVTTDDQNLFKVAYKRVDFTIVDLVNARYLVDVRYPELKPLLVFDPKVYMKAGLYISLKADRHYDERVQKLRQAFQKTPPQKIIDEALK